jgi:predicted AAA+ superfamily ATPase
LQEGFFVIPLYKFSKSYKEKEINMKVYIFNIGFVRALLNKEEIGKKMENTVFLHLKRQENNSPLQEIYYYKTNEGYEVDFLIKEKNQIKELINVTYANSYDEINKREIRALLHAKEELKLSDNIPLTIITWDYEDEKEISWFGKKGRIRFIPLWKWLLNN